MVNVELVDDEPPAEPERDPVSEWLGRVVAAALRAARRAWRRPAVRWPTVGVAAALVVTLVTVPVVDGVRERARLAALAQVPGVLRPLSPGLRLLYSAAGGDQDAAAIRDGFVLGDLLVGLIHQSPGDWTAAGLDPGTGARRWATTLGNQVQWGGAAPQCFPTGTVVACLVTGPFSGPAAGTTTTLWVLDAADGHVVRTATYGDHVRAAAAGGLVVVGRQVSTTGGTQGPWTVTWRVMGEDPVTGDARWTWTSPPLRVAAEDDPSDPLQLAGDYGFELLPVAAPGAPPDDVALRVGADTWLFGPDGHARAHVARPGGWTLEETRGGGIVRLPRVSTVVRPTRELLLDDGTWRALEGTPLPMTVDDGSAPDLVFVTDVSTLTAVDRHTGAVHWQAPIDRRVIGPLFSLSAMVLGSRLYTDTQDLQAYDASTGALLWHAPLAGGPLSTDGTVAVVQSTDEEGFPQGVKAYRLADGREIWSSAVTPLLPSAGPRLTSITFGAPLPEIVVVRSDGMVAVLG